MRSPLPQPVYKKFIFVAEHRTVWEQLFRGTAYLLLGGAANANFRSGYRWMGGGLFPFFFPLVALALTDLLTSIRRVVRQGCSADDRVSITAGALSLAYLGFSLLVGGDWMEGLRFLVPILP